MKHTMPQPPAPTTLRQTRAGKLPAYVDTATGARFTVERNPSEPGVPFEDSGWTVRDTRRANILGHAHTNQVRVYELADARAMVDRVLQAEHLGAVQRCLDSERARLGLPTLEQEHRARRDAQRKALAS